MCAAEFDGCMQEPPTLCSNGPAFLGVCVGWPAASDTGFAGAAGAAGAGGAAAVLETCAATGCSLSLSGEVVAVGTGARAGCDTSVLDLDDQERNGLEWFELATDQGVVTVGFATPVGGPPVAVGTSVALSYERSPDGESISVASGGDLLAHATRGQVLLPLDDLELSRGVALCDEQFSACRKAEHRLDARLGSSAVSLIPSETRALGPFQITLDNYVELIASEPGAGCEPEGLTVAVIRTGS